MSVTIIDLIDKETGKIKTIYTNSGKPYGLFKNTSSQSNLTANTTYLTPSTTTVQNSGITVVNGTDFTVPISGTYLVQISLQIKKNQGTTNKEVSVWLRKNGVDIPNTNSTITVINNNRFNITLFNFTLTLDANDYVQTAFTVNDSNIILESTTDVPSSSFTIVQS